MKTERIRLIPRKHTENLVLFTIVNDVETRKPAFCFDNWKTGNVNVLLLEKKFKFLYGCFQHNFFCLQSI